MHLGIENAKHGLALLIEMAHVADRPELVITFYTQLKVLIDFVGDLGVKVKLAGLATGQNR